MCLSARPRVVAWVGNRAPIDGRPVRRVGVALQPATGKQAQRHDGHALPRRAIDRRRRQPAADTTALQLSGHLSVDQDEPVPVAPVPEFSEIAVDMEFEAGSGLVVGDLLSITHVHYRRTGPGLGPAGIAYGPDSPSGSWVTSVSRLFGRHRILRDLDCHGYPLLS
jgi:hypothetical protein